VPPRIVTARSMGLRFRTGQLAPLGPESNGTVGHYSAGARAANMAEGVARAKAFHADHLSRGWAGIGYHFLIADDGTIVCCRSTFHLGSHVLHKNSGRIGVNMPGTTGDKPTKRQARAFNWLIHNAHTAAMPRVHRTDLDLSTLPLKVHKDLMATSCPGLFTGMYHRGGDPWVEPSGNEEPPDDGFVDLTPDDDRFAEDVAAGRVPPPDQDVELTGPDAVEAEGDTGGDLELPEADEEFDEDLSDVLAGIREGVR
jgi:hypothetical protein